jgi:NTP pyrophosphatase (non-canonical NTP hydrolase)
VIGHLNELGRRVHANARAKGFYDHEHLVVRDPILGDVEGRPLNPSLAAEKLALIHSEVSEILETLRDSDFEHEGEEVADVLIRVLDYAAWRGIDLDAQVARKIEINAGRDRLHGRSW